MNDFLMKIEYDDNMGEYFLKFIDIDDRAKKSRILKRMFQNNISTVVMTISEQAEAQTKSQRGLYDAFVILLKEYTGYSQDEVKRYIYKNIEVSKEDIDSYNKKEFSEFIEKLYKMCSEQIGIQVEMVEGKLTIIHEKNE